MAHGRFCMQRMTAMHERRATTCASSVTCALIGNELKDVREMEIRYEHPAQDGGFEVSCDCGHTFNVPSGSHEAQCPKMRQHPGDGQPLRHLVAGRADSRPLRLSGSLIAVQGPTRPRPTRQPPGLAQGSGRAGRTGTPPSRSRACWSVPAFRRAPRRASW